MLTAGPCLPCSEEREDVFMAEPCSSELEVSQGSCVLCAAPATCSSGILVSSVCLSQGTGAEINRSCAPNRLQCC